MKFEKSKKLENSLSKKWAVRSTIGLALVTALLSGCQTPEPQAAAPEESNVTTEEVAENTNRYIGQVVTIRSKPIEKVGTSTFTVSDQQFFGSEPILVVNATGQPIVLPEDGTDVQVTGEVRNFVYADVEREFDLDLEADAYVDYENQPALIAQSIAVAPKPGELTSNPQQYYGKPLAVTGEIEELEGANTFTLDEEQLFGGQDLLVLRTRPAADQPAIEEGETVAVTGVLRPFVVAELEREYGFSWEAGIQQQLEAEYTNKPVLIAENVYPSAIPDDGL
ncbi:hypothetical protein H6F67_10200 [Microcoleus sp. FACHB-1515]|uniref:hypothetical protein n=1 Tax=Cyanophyceae TaxID=3028117 RepID=UPI001688430A|nr:hypothetical protein [Microcoleus sp. FACHB-1515]MBD2090223.1 hypothetical protein [Microcoleus sp. FACHB-1515]